MSVKPTQTSSLIPTRRQPEAAPSNPLEKVGKALQSAAQNVTQHVQKAVDTFEARLPTPAKLAQANPWKGVTLTGKPLQIPLDALKKVNLGTLRDVVERLFPPKNHNEQSQKFISQTKDFRDTLGQVRKLSLELEMTSPGSPKRAELQKALGAAEGQLQSKYGYTRTSAPKAGALWVDPQFAAKDVPGGQVTASRFPTGTPVTRPPAPMDFLFGQGPRKLTLGEGSAARTVSSPEQYRAAVAARRAELGMPVKDGEPMGVHLALQGGGGKGKRYGAMLSEMYELGVVPTSLSGTSAGSIAAAFAATGAGPAEVQALAQDPRLAKLYDPDLDMKDGGLLNGQKAYDLFDQELRRLTGIKDRPVTFADLKVPLQLIAAKTYDSNAGPNGMPNVSDRVFVFSQETTPDTPVALAMRASMAIPGVFEPVQMVDPTTGHELHLVDGGTLDNLPLGYNKNNLPTIGASLASRANGHPDDHKKTTPSLPSGNLDSTNLLWNAINGYTMLKGSGVDYNDYKDKTQPQANQFMLSLPTWDLTDPDKGNSMLKFGFDPKVDPRLDQQSRQVTRDFLRDFLDDLRVPGSRGTNFTSTLPKDTHFDVSVDVKGKQYDVSYTGGDSLLATPKEGGWPITLPLGQKRIESMLLDNQAFGDLEHQVAHALSNPRNARPSWLPF